MKARMTSRISSTSNCLTVFLLLLTQNSGILADDGLLPNGDFEAAAAAGGVDVWEKRGEVEVVESGQRQGAMLLVVPHGRRAVKLGNDAEIRQVVRVEKGASYSLTFIAARTCAQSESLNVSVPPGSQTIDLQTVYSVRGWDAYAAAFQAAADSVEITLANPGMEEDPACGPILDDVAIKKLPAPDKPQEALVRNGRFENGPWLFRNYSLGVLLPTCFDEEESPLPGWNVESGKPVRFIDSDHYAVPEGKRAIELVSGKEGIISQMVPTRPGRTYSLMFRVGQAGDRCRPPLAVRAFAADQAETVHYTADANSSHQAAALNFTARAENTRIAFQSVYYNLRTDDHTSLCGPVVDDVRVQPSGSVLIGPRWLGFVIGIGLLGMIS